MIRLKVVLQPMSTILNLLALVIISGRQKLCSTRKKTNENYYYMCQQINNVVLMVLKITAILLLIQIVGCSGTFHKMDRWMGVSEGDLLKTLGPPIFKQDKQKGISMYSWDRNPDWNNSCRDIFHSRNNVIIGYTSDCGIWGGLGVPKPSRD